MIHGKKLYIRPLEIGDEEFLYRWWTNTELMNHAGLAYGTLQSKEAVRLSVFEEVQSAKMFSEKRRFIICRKEDGRPIGEMNYNSWDSRNQSCEIGIKICEVSEQGKGYGEDALFHFIDFLFRHLNLNRICLDTMADNHRSQGLYNKLGFKRIGLCREAYYDSRTGQFADVVLMDLLRKEWEGVRHNRI